MVIDIKEIIEKKPHLKDSLILYEKLVRFKEAVSCIYKKQISLDDITYPSELIEEIFNSFSSILDVPEENLAPLKEAMRLGQIDLTRLPLNEIPSFSLPYNLDELAMILFLISKPYFLRLRNSCNLDNIFWQEGRCPVCNSTPSIASISEEGKRKLYCSYCETIGYYNRSGCPICFNNDSKKTNIFLFDEEEGFRIYACESCASYIKTVDNNLIRRLTPDVADIISLPLDIIIQGKGFRRLSPNPLGMIKIV